MAKDIAAAPLQLETGRVLGKMMQARYGRNSSATQYITAQDQNNAKREAADNLRRQAEANSYSLSQPSGAAPLNPYKQPDQ